MEQKTKQNKKCTKCQTEKPMGDYYRNEVSSDGRHSWCKVCLKANSRRWNKENKERHYAINKAWRQRQKKGDE